MTAIYFIWMIFSSRPELKTEERLKEVGGNVDYVRFYEEVIQGLKSGQRICYRPYNCQTMALGRCCTCST